MTFEVFLPESLADWLRCKLIAGEFRDASEARALPPQHINWHCCRRRRNRRNAKNAMWQLICHACRWREGEIRKVIFAPKSSY